MNKKKFITKMLSLPRPSIEYRIGEHLAKFFPEKALIDSIRSASDIDCISMAGRLSLEETGALINLAPLLISIADFLDEEIETTLSGLTSLIEPLLIVFLGVMVGGIAICMFLPIFKMSEIISPSGR